jgi:hypothetical protein
MNLILKVLVIQLILLKITYGNLNEAIKSKRQIGIYTASISCTYVDPLCKLSWYFDSSSNRVFIQFIFKTQTLPTWYGLGFSTSPQMVEYLNLLNIIINFFYKIQDWYTCYYDFKFFEFNFFVS